VLYSILEITERRRFVPRSTDVGLDEIEITSTEKLLALVLMVFFLVGGVWAYSKLDDVGESRYRPPAVYFTPSERAAVERSDRAQRRLERAVVEVERAGEELELAREEYRTALDAGRQAPGLEAAYREARGDLVDARARERGAQAQAGAAQQAADAAQRRAADEASEATRRSELVTFALRLAFVLAVLALAYWLLIRLRRSGSRYVPVAFALVGAAAVLALVFAGDSLADHIDVEQLGPLVLSAAGVGLTLFAFWWLQRHLARRLPLRRVRKGECPFCGYPVRGGDHCEGCGRTVVAACQSCHGLRRVGTPHCGACGVT
jgi:hypothetical protein